MTAAAPPASFARNAARKSRGGGADRASAFTSASGFARPAAATSATFAVTIRCRIPLIAIASGIARARDELVHFAARGSAFEHRERFRNAVGERVRDTRDVDARAGVERDDV